MSEGGVMREESPMAYRGLAYEKVRECKNWETRYPANWGTCSFPAQELLVNKAHQLCSFLYNISTNTEGIFRPLVGISNDQNLQSMQGHDWSLPTAGLKYDLPSALRRHTKQPDVLTAS